MRGDLAKREPTRLQAWETEQLYHSTIEHRKDDPSFILHDGPPYANGDIHLGHTLNKVLKDIVIRYRNMCGFKTPYIPGWDCHGLPIEQQVLKKVGDKIHDMEPLALRKLCLDYAKGWIDIQRKQFKRLGILADWEDPYLTINKDYEVGILKVLHALAQKNLVRKGHKAVHWDPVFRTALAEAEIEYHPHKSPSIYVAMPLNGVSTYPSLKGIDAISIVIWTTTPWTMPANLGISLHPEFDYVALKTESGAHYMVAEGLQEAFITACDLGDCQVVATFKATEFDRGTTKHPIFEDRDSLIMLGEHVTLEQGTGCVHTAPGHGADDFMIGKAYDLPVFCPVDNKGCYSADYPAMEGTFVFDANPKIVEILKEKGLLLGHKIITHDYPFSWRSKKPIIFRATEQWFVELAEGGIREKALEAIDDAVEWIPSWGRERIRTMVERRPEWCISRQRHWGVPIPSIRKLSTDEALLIPEVIEKYMSFVTDEGTDAWYAHPLSDFLPDGFDPSDYEKESDILDVWFDSGASHTAVLKQDPRVSFPADLYLEGSDQHRGWFQSALLLSVGAHETAPFKAVLTHGFVLDGEGKAMSKSMGNVISPLDLIKIYGADILRLWVASLDYRKDVAISDEIIKGTADTYRTIRNSLRFQLGNLFDFNPKADSLPLDQLTNLDRWALNELATLTEEVTEAYQQYRFHHAYKLLNTFYTSTLSARYHDILKDRLYTFAKNAPERRSAQTVIYQQVSTLIRLLAPILVFTADEAQEELQKIEGTTQKRVALSDWPSVPAEWKSPELAAQFESVLKLREQVNEELEQLRTQKVIGKSIDAAVTIYAQPDDLVFQNAQKFMADLPETFIVSAVDLKTAPENDSTLKVVATAAIGERCPRCWRTVEVLTNSSHGDCCPRCAEALR